jgi:hypothetical protein
LIVAIEAATENRIMSDPTREEIDAKLAAVEARTETRFTELNGKIDRLADSISVLRSDIADVKADNRYTRWTIIVTVIASALAAIAALWVTQANLLAAFSAGITLRTETRESPPTTPPRPALRPDAH